MYRLKDYLQTIVGLPSTAVASDEFYCAEADTAMTFLTNQMHDALAAYSYTLVKEGWLRLVYNGRELTLRAGDLYIYSPGFRVSILNGSDDYHSACLIADEYTTLEMPVMWDIIRTAFYPIAELGQPVIRLSPQEADHMWRRMKEIIAYQGSSHHFLKESLRALYSLFVLDLRNVMERTIGNYQYGERATDLFVGFIRLLPRHFVEHHDIGFYAGELHVTTTHLSRVVRQMTGRTVMDYIDQMLLMEAVWLLQTTDLSLSAIAERLHFASQSGFGKFFSRQKGMSPKAYRRQLV